MDVLSNFTLREGKVTRPKRCKGILEQKTLFFWGVGKGLDFLHNCSEGLRASNIPERNITEKLSKGKAVSSHLKYSIYFEEKS